MTTDNHNLQNAIQKVRQQYYDAIAQDIVDRPKRSYADIGSDYGVSEQTVYTIARLRNICRTANSAKAVIIAANGGSHERN